MKLLVTIWAASMVLAVGVGGASAQKCGATWTGPDGNVHTCLAVKDPPPTPRPGAVAVRHLAQPVPVVTPMLGTCQVRAGGGSMTISRCVPTN